MTAHCTNTRAVAVTHRGDGVTVATSLPADLDKAFAALCKERKMTRSALLRELIEKAVAKST